MGWFSNEDTVQGTIKDVEVKAFRNQTTFDPKMPKVVTLVQIQDQNGKNHLAFISGEAGIEKNQKIVCTIKKTWNAYWVYRNNGETRVMPGQFTTKAAYKMIDQYQIVNER